MTLVHSSAPMRISIAGGGTDLPEFYRLGPTAVVTATISQRVHVCAADTAERSLTCLDTPGNPWSYVLRSADSAHHPYHRAAAALLGLRRLPHLTVASSVLPGSGLGGSGAYCAALIDVLLRWSGRCPDPREIAVLAFRLEREALGRTIGQQDAWAAALGGVQRIRFASDGSATTAPRPELHTALTRLVDNGLFLYRVPGARDASHVLAKGAHVTAERYRDTVRAAAHTEEAFASGDIHLVGAVLREHWARKIAVNPSADHPVCHRIAVGAEGSGIFGFKLIGAGGGGHLLIAADPTTLDRTEAFLHDLGVTRVPLSLSSQGLISTAPLDKDGRREVNPCASA